VRKKNILYFGKNPPEGKKQGEVIRRVILRVTLHEGRLNLKREGKPGQQEEAKEGEPCLTLTDLRNQQGGRPRKRGKTSFTRQVLHKRIMSKAGPETTSVEREQQEEPV